MTKHLCYFVVLVTLFITGCANRLPDDLDRSKAIFDIHGDSASELRSDVEVHAAVSYGKSGVIPLAIFDGLQVHPLKQSLAPFSGDPSDVFDSSYLRKVGQAVAWGIDLDAITSGKLKHNGLPLSITERFQVNASPIIGEAAVMGATNMALTSAATGFQVTPGVGSLAGGIGVGLLGGFIAGAITSHAVESTIKGFINSTNFGERMGHASGFMNHEMHIPRMRAISPFYFGKPALDRISSNSYRFIFAREGEKLHDYSTRIFFASTVAVYRGDLYAEKYPETKGWEFIVTGLNFIDVRLVDGDQLRSLEQIRRNIRSKGVVL